MPPRAPSATFPVPIWHAYMTVAEAHRPVHNFLVPKVFPTYHSFVRGNFGYVAATTTTTTTTAFAHVKPLPLTEPKAGRPVPGPPVTHPSPPPKTKPVL